MWIISANNDKVLNSYMISRFEKEFINGSDRCYLKAVMSDGEEVVLESYDSSELLDIGFDDLINNTKSVCRRKYVIFSNETAKIIKMSKEAEPVDHINVIYDEEDINVSSDDDFLTSDNEDNNAVSEDIDYFFKSSDEEESEADDFSDDDFESEDDSLSDEEESESDEDDDL